MTTPNPPAPVTPPAVPTQPSATPVPAPAAPPVQPPATLPGTPAPTYVPPAQLTPPAAPAGPTYQPPVPLPQAPPPGDDDGSKDPSRLPQWAQDQINKLKDENARRRIEARTALVTQHAQFAATQLGVNPAALLGSVAYQELAKQLDPHAGDFPAKLTAAIQQTVAANPWMAAASAAPTTPPAPGTPALPPTPPPTSGAEFPGGAPGTAPITEAQLAAMTPEQITQAFNEGKLKHLL